MSTRVKICGITRVEDATMIAGYGVDAIGLVFYEKSPRNISIQQAAVICDALPPFVTTVALFKDADAASVWKVLEEVNIDLLQFHGSESPEFCRQFIRPYIKAVGMDGTSDLYGFAEGYGDAKGLLLDSHAPGAAGGTGRTFDWTMIPDDLPLPVILAGGLEPENVDEAIRTARPFAVDTSSGVESAPGLKDEEKVRMFMQRVNAEQA